LQAEGQKLYKDLKNFLSAVKVMHESSKRVSETLQEIYSSEWDGHEELKAIAGVRVSRLHSSLATHFCLLLASLSKQIGKQRSQSASFMCIASATTMRVTTSVP